MNTVNMLESLFDLLMSVGIRGSSRIRRVNLFVSHFYLGLAPCSSDNNRQTWRILLGGFILRVSYCPVKFHTGLMMMMIANAQKKHKNTKKTKRKQKSTWQTIKEGGKRWKRSLGDQIDGFQGSKSQFSS